MFVRRSTHDAMRERAVRAEAELFQLQLRFSALTKQWNDLVARINEKGGERFLKYATVQPKVQPAQFTEDEITKLIQLCHPDKHGGKPMATEMTQKLLALKGALTKEPA